MLTMEVPARRGAVVTTPCLDYIRPPQWYGGSPEFEPLASGPTGTYKPSLYNHVIEYSEGRGIFFNALSGAIAVYRLVHEEALLKCLTAPEVSPGEADRDAFESLLHGRFMTPSDLDEHEVIRNRLARGRGRKDQLTLTLAPTMGCNFNCTYCIEPEAFRRDATIMPAVVQDAIIALAEDEIAAAGLQSLTTAWFGGEPLLAVDVIEALSARLIALCDRNQIRYNANITTNGYGLDARAIRVLETCHIRVLKISLDGPVEVHDQRRVLCGGQGTFQRILDNIVAASQTLRVAIRVNVDAFNERKLTHLLDALEAAGLSGKVGVYSAIVEKNQAIEGRYTAFSDRDSFARADHVFHVEAVVRRLAPSAPPPILGNFCSADVERSYMIGPGGELYACWADFGNPLKRIGSVLPFRRTNEAYRREYTDFDPTRHSKCSPCTVMPLCLGGCSRERLYLGEPQCGVYKFNLADRIRAHVDAWFAGIAI